MVCTPFKERAYFDQKNGMAYIMTELPKDDNDNQTKRSGRRHKHPTGYTSLRRRGKKNETEAVYEMTNDVDKFRLSELRRENLRDFAAPGDRGDEISRQNFADNDSEEDFCEVATEDAGDRPEVDGEWREQATNHHTSPKFTNFGPEDIRQNQNDVTVGVRCSPDISRPSSVTSHDVVRRSESRESERSDDEELVECSNYRQKRRWYFVAEVVDKFSFAVYLILLTSSIFTILFLVPVCFRSDD